MGTFSELYDLIFRDFTLDGVSTSGKWDPEKDDIRQIGVALDQALAAQGLGSVSVTKETAADLAADLAHDDETTALVYADTDDVNNDIWLKSGASGAGSWTNTNIVHSAVGTVAIATVQPLVVAARAWANSDTAPDPDDPESKSAKTSALEASSFRDDVNATLEALNASVSPTEAGYALAVIDEADNLALGVNTETGETFMGALDPASPVAAQVLPNGYVAEETPDEADWAFAVSDEEGNTLGFRRDGTIVGKVEGTDSADDAGSNIPLFPDWDIVCWGDSLFGGTAEGTPVTSLAAAFPNRTVTNMGRGGRTSTQIGARQGGVITTLSGAAGGVIPGDGSAVPVTPSIGLISSNATSGTETLTGTINGVAVILTDTMGATDADDVYTVKLATPGAALACPDGSVFVPDFLATYRDHTVLIWVGRNNPTQITTVRDDILAMVAALRPRVKHVLVCAVPSPAGIGKSSAGATYQQFKDLNAELSRTLGPAFIDMHDWFVNRSLIEAGITPTATDTTQMADDAIPASALQADATHPVASINNQIGPFLARNLIARGY